MVFQNAKALGANGIILWGSSYDLKSRYGYADENSMKFDNLMEWKYLSCFSRQTGRILTA